MSLAKRLGRLYDRLLVSSYPTNGIAVPPDVLRYYVNLTGYEYAQTICAFLGDKQRVLIIGDAGGRDAYFLAMAGKKTYIVDIAEQCLPRFALADAISLPFGDQSFDAVVMAEVIEHLIQDYDALREIRRVLREDGVLVLTVPYYHDDAVYHVRIHSPLSIDRLLQASGFRITGYVEKGGGFALLDRFRLYTYTIHCMNLLLFLLTKRTFYASLNRVLRSIDMALGKRRKSFWHRRSRVYGAFIRCVKGDTVDFRELNVKEFGHLLAQRERTQSKGRLTRDWANVLLGSREGESGEASSA